MNCRTCNAPVVGVDAALDPRAVGLRLTSASCGHSVSTEDGRTLWRAGMRWTVPAIDGAGLLAAERRRQTHEEGYTPEHDAEHDPNDLAWAAWCLLDAAISGKPSTEAPKMWPWDAAAWKPEHSPLRRLVITGALIAAEIDRLLMEERRER